jgi:hypothetical protein
VRAGVYGIHDELKQCFSQIRMLTAYDRVYCVIVGHELNNVLRRHVRVLSLIGFRIGINLSRTKQVKMRRTLLLVGFGGRQVQGRSLVWLEENFRGKGRATMVWVTHGQRNEVPLAQGIWLVVSQVLMLVCYFLGSLVINGLSGSPAGLF